MALPYSTRFLGEAVPAATNAIYAVPSGMVAVVRSISMFNAAPGAQALALAVNGAWTLAFWAAVPTDGMEQLTMHQVLNAGDQLVASSGGQPFHVTVSGYLLTATV